MTEKTLTAERREKFEKVLIDFKVCPYDYATRPASIDPWLDSLVAALVDASLSRTERAKEGNQGEQHPELFRGDFRVYPEHLWGVAECLRDRWMFVLPDKPQKPTKKEKGDYTKFCAAMESIKISCGEFGVKALEVTHDKWRAAFKDGIAPYTVAQPTSLINVVAATAREMREAGVPREEKRKEYQKVVVVEEPTVPNPGRIQL